MGFVDVRDKIEEYVKSLAKEELNRLKGFSNDECTVSTNQISHKVCEFIKKIGTEDKYIVNTTLFEKKAT